MVALLLASQEIYSAAPTALIPDTRGEVTTPVLPQWTGAYHMHLSKVPKHLLNSYHSGYKLCPGLIRIVDNPYFGFDMSFPALQVCRGPSGFLLENYAGEPTVMKLNAT